MTRPKLINAEIRAGVWQAEFSGMADGQIAVTHQTVVLPDVTSGHDPKRGVLRISVPIPAAMINEGVQTFIVSTADGEKLTQFTILAGEMLADDLRAEVDLLRAELDLLKSAFRRHCGES